MQSYHIGVIAFLLLYLLVSNLYKDIFSTCDINHLHSNIRLNMMEYYVMVKTIKQTFE